MSLSEPARQGLREALRREGLDTVDGAFAFAGGESLAKPGLGSRERIRFELAASDGTVHELYLKRYGPQPLSARVRTLLRHGRFASPASVEWMNVHACLEAGVATMEPLVWGEEDGGGRSYLVVSAVPGEALERVGEDYWRRHEGDPHAQAELTRKLVELVRRLHAAGYVHRDLYASHVFLAEDAAGVTLHLIDLARMFRLRGRRFRWRVKDLAQLRYSMPPAWVAEHWSSFLHAYLGSPDERELARWSRAIEAKADRIRRHAERKGG